MSNKNDVVIIDLDRPRQLRFGHSALKRLSALTGKSMEELEMETIDFGQVEEFIYCGLLSDARENGETLQLEDMENLLDQAPSFKHVIEKMQEAFHKSFGDLNDMEGNLPPAPNQNRQQRRARGKNGAGKQA